MKIAIIGSRSFNNIKLMNDIIEVLIKKYGNDLEIVSGGANGTDYYAEQMAIAKGIKHTIFKPDFKDGYDVKQYFRRNDKIIEYSDRIIAFWDLKSRGTQYVINHVKAKGKECEVITF